MASPVKCGKCGADPLVTGFSISTVQDDLYMRIGGEVRIISQVTRVADEAFCNCCHTKLPMPAKELKSA